MEVLHYSETSVLTRDTLRNILGNGILHSYRRENLKSSIIPESLFSNFCGYQTMEEVRIVEDSEGFKSWFTGMLSSGATGDCYRSGGHKTSISLQKHCFCLFCALFAIHLMIPSATQYIE
jgi:hypothetical protein